VFLIIPDRLDWITGRWARELALLLPPRTSWTLPSWYLSAHSRWLATPLRKVQCVVCIDPWYAKAVEDLRSRYCPQAGLSSVLHHVNYDDPNAETIARSDLPVGACETAVQALISLGARPENTVLVENGVDHSDFNSRPRVAARASLDIGDREFVIGLSLKMSSDTGGRKGLDIARRIFDEFCEYPGIEFLVSGGGGSKFSDECQDKKWRCRHVGFLDASTLPSFYSAIDLFLCTSRLEAGPATVLEALSCGCPVIASRTGIVHKVVTRSECGVVVDVGDVEHFVSAIQEAHRNWLVSGGEPNERGPLIGQEWSWRAKMSVFSRRLIELRAKAGGAGALSSTWSPVMQFAVRHAKHLENRSPAS